MLISLNWLRDFVDLPADLDARELAERFTLTTAEAEGVDTSICLASSVMVMHSCEATISRR